jgi:hypothetical protein
LPTSFSLFFLARPCYCSLIFSSPGLVPGWWKDPRGGLFGWFTYEGLTSANPPSCCRLGLSSSLTRPAKPSTEGQETGRTSFHHYSFILAFLVRLIPISSPPTLHVKSTLGINTRTRRAVQNSTVPASYRLIPDPSRLRK